MIIFNCLHFFCYTIHVSSISSYITDSSFISCLLTGFGAMFSVCWGSASETLSCLLTGIGNTLSMYSGSASVVSREDFLWQQIIQLIEIESRIVEVANTPTRVQEINSSNLSAFSL